MIAPPIPEALPARLGRTDNRPAFAFGKTIPLPTPASIMHPKNTVALPNPNQNMNKDKRRKKFMDMFIEFKEFDEDFNFILGSLLQSIS